MAEMAARSDDAHIAQDRQRLVLEAKLKHAQAALDRRVADLVQAREQGAAEPEAVDEDKREDQGGMGREGLERLVSRRLQLYNEAYSELGKMRELREQRHYAHQPFRRPPAVLFRRRRLSAEIDQPLAAAETGIAPGLSPLGE
eukprot:COSAG02_NODE_2455_length_8817_cov_9.067791_4_plen_143_part_00